MSKTETKDVIVFTDKEELDTYNEMLLNGFMKYLSNRQKKNHDVVHVGAKVLLMQDEYFVKDFLSQLHMEKIQQRKSLKKPELCLIITQRKRCKLCLIIKS